MSAILKFRSSPKKGVAVSSQGSQLSLCMDFRFNMLRNVKKVVWKNEKSWYRQVKDGLNWFGYCCNINCIHYKDMFVSPRGYGIFKLEQELHEFSCPVCLQNYVEIVNVGFVNCEWALKGAFRSDPLIKVISEGQTYDNKLYIFSEINYSKEFDHLNIFAKKIEGQPLISNVQSESSFSSISGSNYSEMSPRPINNKGQVSENKSLQGG